MNTDGRGRRELQTQTLGGGGVCVKGLRILERCRGRVLKKEGDKNRERQGNRGEKIPHKGKVRVRQDK